jgi:hypothetical protein
MTSGPVPEVLRPRDLALLLLASRDLRPRQRARDQQADLAGLDLKRRVLEQLAEIDPEPADLDAALLRISENLDAPSGPARAMVTLVREEWQTACQTPEWVALLLADALQPEKPEGPARGRHSR